MQMHEKRYIKRAGVAGIALRARGTNMHAEAAPAARRRTQGFDEIELVKRI